jgi:acyl-CoA synthetase (AMP-forming)/AMP-acid ligase II
MEPLENMTKGPARRPINGWSIRWDEERARRSRAEGWWPGQTIGQIAARLAEAQPERVLIVDGVRRLDAQNMYHEACVLAGAFIERGYTPGSVVSFMLPNWHEACVVYLAATMAGLVAHPLVTAYRETELSFMLADSCSRMIFVPAQFRGTDHVAVAERAIAGFDAPPEIVVVRGEVEGHTSYRQLLDGQKNQQLPAVDPDSVRMVIYTSGTTGRPKGVLHTHNSLGATVTQLHRHWMAGRGEKFFVPSPVSHIGGSIYAFEFPIMFNTVAVLQDVWDAEAAVHLIESERCTHTAGATPFLQQLLAAAQKHQIRLPSLRLFICGGASVPPMLIREATAYFDNCIVTRVFGLTEVPTITVGTIDLADVNHSAETDGRIGIAEVKLLSGDGDETRGEGEVLARGPQMLAGYLHEEDENGAFDEQGFFRTGDLAELVDGHFLRISGRRKDIIIRHGENISPKEIEDLLVQHSDIQDAAVVGLPSAKTGEIACAVIVPKVGRIPDLRSVRAFLEGRGLAKFKIPERIVLRQELPRNAAGKILKVRLREELMRTEA